VSELQTKIRDGVLLKGLVAYSPILTLISRTLARHGR